MYFQPSYPYRVTPALLPDLRLVFDACEMDRDFATFENKGVVYTNVSLVCCNCRLEENGVASFDEAICRLQSQLSERLKMREGAGISRQQRPVAGPKPGRGSLSALELSDAETLPRLSLPRRNCLEHPAGATSGVSHSNRRRGPESSKRSFALKMTSYSRPSSLPSFCHPAIPEKGNVLQNKEIYQDILYVIPSFHSVLSHFSKPNLSQSFCIGIFSKAVSVTMPFSPAVAAC